MVLILIVKGCDRPTLYPYEGWLLSAWYYAVAAEHKAPSHSFLRQRHLSCHSQCVRDWQHSGADCESIRKRKQGWWMYPKAIRYWWGQLVFCTKHSRKWKERITGLRTDRHPHHNLCQVLHIQKVWDDVRSGTQFGSVWSVSRGTRLHWNFQPN